jgi:uncharacterized YigZ family protein
LSLFKDTYQTIKAPAEALFKDKGSKFIGYAFPATNEETVKRHLQDLWKQYHDATHICYAYIIGPNGEATRANDDGEPSNSAGKPIQRAIQSADLTNVVVYIVRYFGGTLLGVPGLINAYGNCARMVLELAAKEECVMEELFSIQCDYAYENEVFRLIKQQQIHIVLIDKGAQMTVEVAVRKLKAAMLEDTVKKNPHLSLLYKGSR